MRNSVSIVIPTKDGGPDFRRTLEAIRRQPMDPEIIVVDSGSGDGTAEMARSFGARVEYIHPQNFNHGETRNEGIRLASGRFCVMLVQDAVPTGETWLEDLLAPFADDRVVGVTARQQPRPDSDPVGCWQVRYHNQFLGDALAVRECSDWKSFQELTFEQRLRLASFDNVCSALRRDYWQDQPFQPLSFAEDLDWGKRAIASGRRLVYNPAVTVIHSHTRSANYHMRRSYVSGRIVPRILEVAPEDPQVRDDAEFFTQVGYVFGEAQSIISNRIADWQEFRRNCGLDQNLWNLLWAKVTGKRRYTGLGRIRESFYFLLEQLGAYLPPDRERSEERR